VLINVITTGNAWFIYDNKREGYNEANDTLSPNYNTLEDSTYKLDLVSNGFKIRSTQNAHNQSGQTFLYYAIAEAPFKFANAR
jgi:predicted type IV restriction endonuclease